MNAKRKKASPSRVSEIFGKRAFDRLGLGLLVKEYLVKKAWVDAVGAKISKKAAPSRLIKKTLYVTAGSPAWATELRYHKDEIIAKLNALAGEGTITDIIFKTGAAAPELPATKKTPDTLASEKRALTEKERLEIERTVAAIKDPEIKKAVKKAMESSKEYS